MPCWPLLNKAFIVTRLSWIKAKSKVNIFCSCVIKHKHPNLLRTFFPGSYISILTYGAGPCFLASYFGLGLFTSFQLSLVTIKANKALKMNMANLLLWIHLHPSKNKRLLTRPVNISILTYWTEPCFLAAYNNQGTIKVTRPLALTYWTGPGFLATIKAYKAVGVNSCIVLFLKPACCPAVCYSSMQC